MGYVMLTANCCNCQRFFMSNPDFVPSIRINGVKEPLCRDCFDKWNELHRTSKGLEPVELNPEAYSPLECD